jgi:hypothetical protein
MLITTLLAVTLLAAPPAGDSSGAASQDAAARDAITATALDYIEGFYTADAARMTRALHPDLAKRILVIDRATGAPKLDHMTAAQLIDITGRRKGMPPPANQQKDVTVLDVFGNAATAKVIANDWIDYLHLVKWNDRWVIVNVLWEMKK